MHYDNCIEYRKGKAHGNADALSRLCIDCEENENDSEEEFITINVIICEETLNEDQSEDNDLVWIFDLKKQALSLYIYLKVGLACQLTKIMLIL